MPLSTLKIDKSLVHGIGVDKRDEAILKAAIAMAKALQLNVIAEGVETRPQHDFLIREGCEVLQGFLHARPMTFDNLVVFIDQNHALYRQQKTGIRRKTVKKSEPGGNICSLTGLVIAS